MAHERIGGAYLDALDAVEQAKRFAPAAQLIRTRSGFRIVIGDAPATVEDVRLFFDGLRRYETV